MTALEMATEFVRTMNPEMRTDGSAFAIYEYELPDDRFNLEVCAVKYRTAIDLVDKNSLTVDYTFAKTITDVEAIADGIEYLLDKWEVEI